jgi:hypothetical protein
VRKTPVVPLFGPTTGFVVNYTPEWAVRLDLDGNPGEYFGQACSPGQVALTLGRRGRSAHHIARIFGVLP